MVEELEDLVPGFSKVNHTRCFLHVTNLVARTLVKQFDLPKSITMAPTNDITDPDHDLKELADGLHAEELEMQEALLKDAKDDQEEGDDNLDGWIDEMAALSQAEREDLQKSIRPVCKVLVKVCNVQ